MSLPIARKYRPMKLSQVVGQPTTCRMLQNSIILNREIKAMLLTGIRGTGKTTLARIYAAALNCPLFADNSDVCGVCPSCLEAKNGTHPDIIEYDAASNNGVDFIRDLNDLIGQIPSYSRRIIIFDEAHMFSKQAQAALLKILEEPPKQLTFILVTTDPDKLEDTIRSRCLSMPLKAISGKDLELSISGILEQEGKQYTEDFVSTLSLTGGGSLRDVQQILDQCILAAGDGIVDSSYLEDAVGVVSVRQYRAMAPVFCSLDIKKGIEAIERWYNEGYDLDILYRDGVPNLLRDFMVVLSGAYSDQITLLSGIPADVIRKRLTLSYEQVKLVSGQWESLLELMGGTHHPKIIWSMFMINICANKE